MKRINTYILVLIFVLFIQAYFVYKIDFQIYFSMNLWGLPFLFSAVSLLFTYIIYIQSGNKSSNYLIYFFFAGSTAFSASLESGLGNLVALITLKISLQLTGYFFHKFVLESLANKRIIKRKRAGTEVYYLFMLVLIIAMDISRLFINYDVFVNFSRTLSILYFMFNISLPIFKVIYLLITKQKEQKSFLIWMLFIPTVAFAPFIFLHALPSIVGKPWIDPYIAAFTFFAIPIGYTYLIVTKKLFDLNFAINRFIYYGGLAFIPSLLISFVLVYIGSPPFSFSNIMQVFTLLLVFNMLFLLLKEQFDFYFRDSLFHDKNNALQFIERVVKDLSMIVNIPELENYISKEMNKRFKSIHLTKVKYNQGTNKIEYFHLIGNATYKDEPLKELIQNNKKDKYISYNNSLGLFLLKQENEIYYLLIEKKENDNAFNISEKSWLIIFISYVRLVYENIWMNEKNVQQLIESKEQTSASLSRFLFHFAESERKRLAGDIHDTVLQEQIYIYRKLNEMTDDRHELEELKALLKQVIDKTRQTCSEMLPNSLSDQGLTHALTERFETFKQKAGFHIDYEIDLVNEQFIDYEKTLVIYRVIEELLNNAMKHSEAERVSIYVWQTSEQIFIDYLDDGKGFAYQKAKNSDRIGLRSLVERVKSAKGKIEFETDIPKRVKIYITIPR